MHGVGERLEQRPEEIAVEQVRAAEELDGRSVVGGAVRQAALGALSRAGAKELDERRARRARTRRKVVLDRSVDEDHVAGRETERRGGIVAPEVQLALDDRMDR